MASGRPLLIDYRRSATRFRPAPPPFSSDLMDPSLAELVEKTHGLQPLRRIFHAVNGTALVLLMRTTGIQDRIVFLALATLLCALLLMDGVRLAVPKVNRAFFRSFSLLASPRETARLASSTWYLLGILLSLILFPRDIALAAILVLALADPAAGYVGRRWGRRRLGGGTVEGSLVFIAVAFGALALWAPWPQALGAALFTAAVEILPWPIDDNLSVPLTAAVALLLLA